jgi:ribosomal protein S18 acetylase RimI-like enzyme
MSDDPRPGTGATSVPVRITEVDRVADVDDVLVAAFATLIPQLSSSSPPPTSDELRDIVSSPATVLLVARAGAGGSDGGIGGVGPIVGSLTLAVFRLPTGVRAWIEDVVVDGSVRGTGVGEALVAEAVRRAGDHGAKTVDLTSRPDREAANRLYLRAGFVARETNVYRRALDSPAGGP